MCVGVFVQINEGARNAKSCLQGYVIQENGCWDWVGGTTRTGALRYGILWNNGRHHRASRWMYRLTGKTIPEGFHLDHLCRNTLCVNPDHLEPVPQRVNCFRGMAPSAENARKTHCKWGHPFGPDSVFFMRTEGAHRRICKECRRERHKRDKANGVGVKAYWANPETARQRSRESYHRKKGAK